MKKVHWIVPVAEPVLYYIISRKAGPHKNTGLHGQILVLTPEGRYNTARKRDPLSWPAG